jgi:hypothetical protein
MSVKDGIILYLFKFNLLYYPNLNIIIIIVNSGFLMLFWMHDQQIYQQ